MSASELEHLRAERDALLEHDVDRWLDRLRTEGSSYRAFEASISYRVTAPIRLTGAFLRRVRSDGVRDALGLAVATVRKRASR
jgi:hypothetical protein